MLDDNDRKIVVIVIGLRFPDWVPLCGGCAEKIFRFQVAVVDAESLPEDWEEADADPDIYYHLECFEQKFNTAPMPMMLLPFDIFPDPEHPMYGRNN